MMNNKDKLPFKMGGEKAVTIPEPHFKWPDVDKAAEQAVIELLRKGELSYFRLDGAVKQFEENFKRQMGLKYAVSTHSGTAAIHAGWFALNLPPGTEVIVPAYTHIGTVMPLFHVGLVPVLCDIDPEFGNISPDAIQKAITPRTGAVAVTHQFGISADMEEIVTIAEDNNLKILEDCSHAHGSIYKDQPVGTWGDVACFSLQAHKTVPVGEGGILLTSNPKIAERASLLGHFRQQRDFSSEELAPIIETGFGLKSRLHPLAAAIGIVALENMKTVCTMRTRNHNILSDLIETVPGLSVLKAPEDCDQGGYFRFILKVDPDCFAGLNTEQIAAAQQDEGAAEVRSGSLARCLHSFKIFQDTSYCLYSKEWAAGSDSLHDRPTYKLGDFPNAEFFSANTLQLPAFTSPCEELLRQYVSAFAKVQEHADKLLKVY